MVLLAALSIADGRCCVMLFHYFAAFISPYYIALEPLQTTSSDYTPRGDAEPSIVSRAFISIKLWLLVAHKSSSYNHGTGSSAQEELSTQGCNMIWNELWPPFEAVVVNLLQTNTATNSLVSSNVTSHTACFLLRGC